MKTIPFHNSFAMLGRILVPDKNVEFIRRLVDAASGGGVNWENLSQEAASESCTPLLYLRMYQLNLLRLLPTGLRDQLKLVYLTNVARNELIRTAIVEFLTKLHHEGIDCILLKGGAVLIDDLYNDPGARFMSDIDVLVQRKTAERVQTILKSMGYKEFEDTKGVSDLLAEDHHHLPPLKRPNSSFFWEVHYQVMSRQGAGCFQDENVWQSATPYNVDGLKVHLLNPTDRLLHNTLHALISGRALIRSKLSLRDLVEFAALTERYEDVVDWSKWYSCGKSVHMGFGFDMYLGLARELFGISVPELIPTPNKIKKAMGRFIRASEDGSKKSDILRYYSNLPLWIWRNNRYANGEYGFFFRFFYLLRRFIFSLELKNTRF